MKKYRLVIDVCCAMTVEVAAEDEDRAEELVEQYMESDRFFTDCREMCEFAGPEPIWETMESKDTDETEESVTAVEV